MAETSDIGNILEAAICNEVEAHEFYIQVSDRATDLTVKQTFLELAMDELGHRDFLRGCLNNPRLLGAVPAVKDYKVAEATTLTNLSIEMKPADALALAMKKEEYAARDYEALAASSTTPDVKGVFENLARMEIGHKARLETLFVDIGYPEVF